TGTERQLNRPLILAPEWDLHAAAVTWALKKHGVDAVRVPSLADDTLSPLSLHLDTSESPRLASRIAWGDICTVWYRRPKKSVERNDVRDADLACIRKEWS